MMKDGGDACGECDDDDEDDSMPAVMLIAGTRCGVAEEYVDDPDDGGKNTSIPANDVERPRRVRRRRRPCP